MLRLFPHHAYLCHRHRYWIGPPDAGQPATRLGPHLADVVAAQRRHHRLVRRHGTSVAFDAVLTGFLICGHLWSAGPHDSQAPWHRWARRTEILIPAGQELTKYSASRLFAAVYPEAVDLATVIASPHWRAMATAQPTNQERLLAEFARRLGRRRPSTAEADNDPILHWIKFDAPRPPSQPEKTFPDTRDYRRNRLAAASAQSRDRQDRSAYWFSVNRRGTGAILRHRHLRPVLIRAWSPPMDGITAAIWASQTTHDLHPRPVAAAATATETPELI